MTELTPAQQNSEALRHECPRDLVADHLPVFTRPSEWTVQTSLAVHGEVPLTSRNSGSCLLILPRMVRAAVSFLSLACQQGTTLCVSTSWKGTLMASAICRHRERCDCVHHGEACLTGQGAEPECHDLAACELLPLNEHMLVQARDRKGHDATLTVAAGATFVRHSRPRRSGPKSVTSNAAPVSSTSFGTVSVGSPLSMKNLRGDDLVKIRSSFASNDITTVCKG